MTKKRLKNKVLKALAYINGLILVCAAAGLDSDPLYVPLTLIVITGTWLMLFAYANGYLNINYKEAESNENRNAGYAACAGEIWYKTEEAAMKQPHADGSMVQRPPLPDWE